MNNEQNNMFGIPNQVPQDNQAMPSNNMIPGAGLTPMTPNNIPTSNQQEVNLNSIIGGQAPQQTPLEPTLTPSPIPGIVTGNENASLPNMPNTPINTLPTENLTQPITQPINNNITPGIINNTPVELNPTPMPNINQTIQQQIPSSESIINSQPAPQPILSPNIPINQPSGEIITENKPNVLGDATPLSNESNDAAGSDVVSVGKYLITFILFSIPLIGPIMLLVKAFGGEKNKNIKNLARAQLLLALIIVVLSIVAAFVILPSIINSVSNISGGSSYYY